MKRLALLLSFTLFGIGCSAPRGLAAGPAIPDIAWFRTVTQSLRDGITTGDASLWSKYLARNFIMTDEDGTVFNREQFLASLKPLRPGFSGAESVRGLTVRQWDKTAVVHFWMDEQENAYGELFRTTYVETDTFSRHADTWKMVAAQVTVVPRDLAPVKVDRRIWATLVGEYGLNGNPNWPYYVFLRNGELYGGHVLKAATRLIPLSPLVYYRSGSIHIMVFVRDPRGAVSRVLELHKYNEVVLDRILTPDPANNQ